MRKRKELSEMTINELKKRLLSTILTSLREGLAAIRIAEYLNEKLKSMGIANDSGPAGGVLFIDTGEQSSLAGIDIVYDVTKDFLLQKSQPQKGRRKSAQMARSQSVTHRDDSNDSELECQDTTEEKDYDGDDDGENENFASSTPLSQESRKSGRKICHKKKRLRIGRRDILKRNDHAAVSTGTPCKQVSDVQKSSSGLKRKQLSWSTHVPQTKTGAVEHVLPVKRPLQSSSGTQRLTTKWATTQQRILQRNEPDLPQQQQLSNYNLHAPQGPRDMAMTEIQNVAGTISPMENMNTSNTNNYSFICDANILDFVDFSEASSPIQCNSWFPDSSFCN